MRQVIIYPGEDGYWVAECPSLPGCISQGETKEEAIENIKEAIEAYTSALKDPEDVVKAGAMVGLAAMGKDLVQDRMVELLTDKETNEEIRGGAAWVLGEMMDEKSLEILERAAEEDESPFVRVHAKASILAHEQAKAPERKLRAIMGGIAGPESIGAEPAHAAGV